MIPRLKYNCRQDAHKHLDGQEIVFLYELKNPTDGLTHIARLADGTTLHIRPDEIDRNPFALTKEQYMTFSREWRDAIDSLQSQGYAVNWLPLDTRIGGCLQIVSEGIEIRAGWVRSNWVVASNESLPWAEFPDEDSEAITMIWTLLDAIENMLQERSA